MPGSIRVIAHGKSADDEGLRAAVLALRQRGHSVDVRVTSEAGDATRFARDAVRDGVEAVAAAGGDGTLHEVVQGLLADRGPGRTAFGVVPLGTANDFARACGIPPGDAGTALEIIAQAGPTAIDVGRLDDRLFLNVASGGFVTELTAATPEEMKQRLGGVAYLLTGLMKVGSIEARPAKLAAPGWDWSGNLYVLAVGNGRQAGGGFRLCDRAILDDGLLDVVVIPELPLARTLALLGELLAGATPADSEHLIYRQVARLDVEAPGGMRLNLDGEPHAGHTFHFDVLPRRLPFLLPAGAPVTAGAASR
jgi:lipid kinase YegS